MQIIVTIDILAIETDHTGRPGAVSAEVFAQLKYMAGPNELMTLNFQVLWRHR